MNFTLPVRIHMLLFKSNSLWFFCFLRIFFCIIFPSFSFIIQPFFFSLFNLFLLFFCFKIILLFLFSLLPVLVTLFFFRLLLLVFILFLCSFTFLHSHNQNFRTLIWHTTVRVFVDQWTLSMSYNGNMSYQ